MERCALLESQIMDQKYTGIAPDNYRANFVEISPYCHLRTIEIGFKPLDGQEKPKLVFIHGFGASGLMFWRIMRPLAEHYHVIFVDLPGMGSSTRVPFLSSSAAEA
mmetsp:Transcript_18249/g.22757  ORF Transcript_18249/g.22757 Transcript_18249/m.22757 type:complete len:106 (+) Transcript_18249:145-462(+)